MMTFKETLKNEVETLGIELDELALDRFQKYYEMLIDYNTRMNLTAITEEYEVIVKHFCDSLYLISKVDVPNGASLIDVGTGAGFPGIPLLIARPDLKVTLLHGLNKRLVFLEDVLKNLNLKATIIHARAEEGSHEENLREKFDFATSRAVARQSVLCEYCLPYVRLGGSFVALKGPQAQDELKDAQKGTTLLGGKVESVMEYSLSDESNRALIVTKKIAKTPQKYPRHNSKIKKSPL